VSVGPNASLRPSVVPRAAWAHYRRFPGFLGLTEWRPTLTVLSPVSEDDKKPKSESRFGFWMANTRVLFRVMGMRTRKKRSSGHGRPRDAGLFAAALFVQLVFLSRQHCGHVRCEYDVGCSRRNNGPKSHHYLGSFACLYDKKHSTASGIGLCADDSIHVSLEGRKNGAE
jgi:hypothetical protein